MSVHCAAHFSGIGDGLGYHEDVDSPVLQRKKGRVEDKNSSLVELGWRSQAFFNRSVSSNSFHVLLTKTSPQETDHDEIFCCRCCGSRLHRPRLG
ncbi:hypothetical protein RRG08_014029 [Elysia crispata]|uniref:Uncharacterized protein n=1 Tax=Elysia crispata TaxID=231223 RepID=A0AAE0ZZG2_9GAST|nr:hypothetical protein RRG08_014029 [Elysia crispata]